MYMCMVACIFHKPSFKSQWPHNFLTRSLCLKCSLQTTVTLVTVKLSLPCSLLMKLQQRFLRLVLVWSLTAKNDTMFTSFLGGRQSFFFSKITGSLFKKKNMKETILCSHKYTCENTTQCKLQCGVCMVTIPRWCREL